MMDFNAFLDHVLTNFTKSVSKTEYPGIWEELTLPLSAVVFSKSAWGQALRQNGNLWSKIYVSGVHFRFVCEYILCIVVVHK
jgi:hypothetical protein